MKLAIDIMFAVLLVAGLTGIMFVGLVLMSDGTAGISALPWLAKDFR